MQPLSKDCTIKVDPLAQSVEHNTFNVGVLGSSPKRITEIKGKSLIISDFLFYPSFLPLSLSHCLAQYMCSQTLFHPFSASIPLKLFEPFAPIADNKAFKRLVFAISRFEVVGVEGVLTWGLGGWGGLALQATVGRAEG